MWRQLMAQGINPADYGVTPFTTGQLTREDVQLIVRHHRSQDS